MIQECSYCKEDNQLIKQYNYWRVSLHPNQCYLGRCRIVLNRHLEDLTEINDDEQKELFSIMKNLRQVIIDLFGANLFNYTSAGNVTRHLHLHFIPRYNHEVEFESQRFKDENWGRNHAPYPKDFRFPEAILTAIKQKISSQL
ncbi:MAG TPA: HIT family protein [Candidatus Pacearchaeota archaeon]|nr:HIT domain protein [archaeon BMS3Abin17]HDK42313.1 HIT family protein [Candidatus Pacearchaeota archaeon]HDZ60271.1 HIT family protein [Candidatus Pacearchaeota archaeon]